MNKKLYLFGAILMCLTFVLAACSPKEAPVTETCLTIGATYGGPITDAGYNQAMYDAVAAIKTNIPCVNIIEAENVYDEAGATSTIEQMIQNGATLIFATASTHQNPAFELSKTNPDVKFESAGGWLMSDNFANYYGNPPEGWYLMGVAAGMMTQTNKLGFVASFPYGWTLTFVNAFELGAQSVNPDIQTEVKFTFDWADHAKEADAILSSLDNSTGTAKYSLDILLLLWP